MSYVYDCIVLPNWTVLMLVYLKELELAEVVTFVIYVKTLLLLACVNGYPLQGRVHFWFSSILVVFTKMSVAPDKSTCWHRTHKNANVYYVVHFSSCSRPADREASFLLHPRYHSFPALYSAFFIMFLCISRPEYTCFGGQCQAEYHHIRLQKR